MKRDSDIVFHRVYVYITKNYKHFFYIYVTSLHPLNSQFLILILILNPLLYNTMLGCLVLGESFFYLDIDIQKVSNISFLKDELRRRKKMIFIILILTN
jgi:hypothetical protein